MDKAGEALAEVVLGRPGPVPVDGGCPYNQVEAPFVLVIFGATGDLAGRMLFPALLELFAAGSLPSNFAVVGAGRTDLTDEAFREHVRGAIAAHAALDQAAFDRLAPHCAYRRVAYDDPADFKRLAASLNDLAAAGNLGGNRIFYLSVPPTVYEAISVNLGRAGLSSQAEGYARLVIEKPFGRDLTSSRELNRALHAYFSEEQVFRIDHYLAKETVQNIMTLRFANTLFEPLWNRRYIDHVSILASEALGVEHRASYYDSFGVLRDMFQNHMMQLLALCAVEPPPVFAAEPVRDEKTKVYRALRPFPVEAIDEHLTLGQYAAGTVEGEPVPGYRDEPGVPHGSTTPTFAAMKVFCDNWRWQGVPFYLVSGKRLAEKRTQIAVQFKPVPLSMFRSVLGGPIEPNRLLLCIQPEERVSLTFQAKAPGPMCLRSVTMNFDYYQDFGGPVLDAYAKVFLDCMLGDQTLFWRQDGVDLSWSFLMPVLEACEARPASRCLHPYPAGSWGPEAAAGVLSAHKLTQGACR